MSLLKKIRQSKFVRDVVIVASGTAMSQIIAFIFIPAITRIYGPEVFGTMGTFESVAMIAASMSSLAYPMAIVLPKEDRSAKDISTVSMYIAIFLASLITVVLLFFQNQLFTLLKIQSISNFAFLIPLYMLLTSWLRVEQQWLMRKKMFKTTAKILIIKSLILNSAKTFIGLFKPIAAALIIPTTLAIGFHALLIRFNIIKVDKLKPQNQLLYNKQSTGTLMTVARKYYDFPFYRAPVLLLEAISTNLPIVMLSVFFGPAAAGFYVLGKKLLKVPTKLIGRSVGNVFYPKITKAAHKGKNLQRLIINATLGLAATGFLPFFLVILFGPWIFNIVFGAEWITAGEYARWISFVMFFEFIAGPSSIAVMTIGLQKGYLMYKVISTVLKVAGLYAGFAIFKNDIIAVALFSATGTISLIILIFWVVISSKNTTFKERF